MPEEKMPIEDEKLHMVANTISNHWHKMIELTMKNLPGMTQGELFAIMSLSLIKEITGLLDAEGITEMNAVSDDSRKLTITITTLEAPNHETH